METSTGIIETIKERKRIEDERIKKLHTAVKENQENRRKQAELPYRPE